MLISAIVATSINGVIGKDNQIPWYMPADMRYFKRMTLDHCVIMGKNSFRSLGRPLPKRTNIVITRDPFFVADGVVVVHSITEALEHAFQTGEQEAFVIGGGEIYRQTMDLWDRVYLTEIKLETEGDVYFPPLEESDWREISREPHEADEKNKYAYTFRVLERVVLGEQVQPGPSSH